VIVLKDLTLQQLNSVIEFIYLGQVAIPEEDAHTFKASLEALRISLDDLQQDEEEVEGADDDEEEEEEENIEVEEAEEELDTTTEPPAPPEFEIKKEPEWDEKVIVKEEPIEKDTVTQTPASMLKVASVTSVARSPPKPQQIINITPAPGVIRIRTPQSINEKVRPSESPMRTVKIVQRLPMPTQAASSTNIQELSKRLSKAILIRRVKKSDGSFVSERSPVRIVQGVKIQKVGQPSMAKHLIPMRPQVVQGNRVMLMPSEGKRMMPLFRCSHCSKAFNVNKRRNAHEKYCFKNPSRPSSQCPYCPMVLCNPMYITTHIRKVHGIGENGERLEGSEAVAAAL
jgi:hypothetical protein